MLARATCIVLAALALGFAPAPLPPPAGTGLVGTWELIGHSHAGQPLPRREGVSVAVITRDQLAFRHDGKPTHTFRLTVDAGARPPALDMERDGAALVRFRGIYQITGDTLRLAYYLAIPDVRPGSLDEKDDLVVLTFRRKK